MTRAPLETLELEGEQVLVFAGTEVPFQELLDCLRRNGSLEDFLALRPSVTHQLALAALAHVAELGK